MVKNEIVMGIYKNCFAVAVMLAVSLTSVGQEYSYDWKSVEMNGTRTRVTFANADNVKEAMGEVKGRKYFAPDGRVFKKGSTRAAVKVMIDAQAKMADVKQVIAYAPEAMIKHAPECALSDWFIDLLMNQCSESPERKLISALRTSEESAWMSLREMFFWMISCRCSRSVTRCVTWS